MKIPPRTEIEQRLHNLRSAMRKHKLGGFLASSREDVHYLSGFTGDDSLLLVTQRGCWLLTDGRYTDEAAQSARLAETVLWKRHPARFAGELVKKQRIKTLGFCAGAITVAHWTTLKKGARSVQLENHAPLLSALRAVKSSWEVREIKTALRCGQDAFTAFRNNIRVGMTEAELGLELEWQMRTRGATTTAFETIMAEGPNAALPHAHAGSRKLKPGSLLLIDWGAHCGAYNSDLTRVLFVGSISKLWKRRYDLVLQAQRAGIANVAPGVPGADCDAAARDVFETAGELDQFTHSLGHGVGLQVHEMPRLSRVAKEPLVPGQIVTVEPGLYYPRRGGIRIEDMVLVTPKGRTVLSTLPKDLDWAIL